MDLNSIYKRHFFALLALRRAHDLPEQKDCQEEVNRLGTIIAHVKLHGTPGVAA